MTRTDDGKGEGEGEGKEKADEHTEKRISERRSGTAGLRVVTQSKDTQKRRGNGAAVAFRLLTKPGAGFLDAEYRRYCTARVYAESYRSQPDSPTVKRRLSTVDHPPSTIHR